MQINGRNHFEFDHDNDTYSGSYDVNAKEQENEVISLNRRDVIGVNPPHQKIDYHWHS
jgi:hypothetical protein